jgi:hypothetical protein
MRARTRFKWATLIGSCVLGGVLGAMVSGANKGQGHLFGDPTLLKLDPGMAIVIAIAFAAAMVGLPLYFYSKVDELKVRQNLQGMTGGCLAVLGGYPAWQSLAAGGLLPQPTAVGMFALCYFAMLVVFLVMRFRS